MHGDWVGISLVGSKPLTIIAKACWYVCYASILTRKNVVVINKARQSVNAFEPLPIDNMPIFHSWFRSVVPGKSQMWDKYWVEGTSCI